MKVPLPDPVWAVTVQETKNRILRYDELGLTTDRTNGNKTRWEYQLNGTSGESAHRCSVGDPPTAPWSNGLDGGVDYTLPDGRTVQVMTGARLYTPCLCYYPRFKPLKADLIVKAVMSGYHEVTLLGVITRAEFLRLEKPTLIGSAIYPAIPLEAMTPYDEWLATLLFNSR
jgi:hypothetical protein